MQKHQNWKLKSPEVLHNQHESGPKERNRSTPNHQFGLQTREPCYVKTEDKVHRQLTRDTNMISEVNSDKRHTSNTQAHASRCQM